MTLRQQHRCDAVHVLPPYPLVALGIILDHSMLKIRVGFRLQVVKKTPIYSAFADFQFLLCCVITVHQRCRRSYGRGMLYYTAAGRAENQRFTFSLSRCGYVTTGSVHNYYACVFCCLRGVKLNFHESFPREDPRETVGVSDDFPVLLATRLYLIGRPAVCCGVVPPSLSVCCVVLLIPRARHA